MRVFIFAALTLTALAVSGAHAMDATDRILYIGILTDPMEECATPPSSFGSPVACIESYYARWLEAVGVRVVPIPWNTTTDTLDYFLARLNGVLFPGGGGLGDAMNAYFSSLQYIVNAALAMNAKGDKFFVWGTCFGFQMIAAAVANDLNLVTGGFEGMYPLMMALNFTAAQVNSAMFGEKTTPAEILDALRTHPSTLNWHHAGILPAAWIGNAPLRSHLTALSTNTEPSGQKSFISSFEGKTANIFATQFHPERIPYEFSNAKIGHDDKDLSVTRYLAGFVRSRLQLNTHSFASAAEAEALVLENYASWYQGYGTYTYYVDKFVPINGAATKGDAVSAGGVVVAAGRRRRQIKGQRAGEQAPQGGRHEKPRDDEKLASLKALWQKIRKLLV